MNTSQTSKIFSSSSFNSSKHTDTSYECIISNTKVALNKNITDVVHEPTFTSHFTTILEDCGNSVCLILDAITHFMEQQDVNVPKLCEHIEHMISLLKLLANFLKTVVEAETMSCKELKSFPITTGQILVAVFKHCKESEILYGSYLSSLQNQLKELFRTCHELQLVYLTILQKHFVFDLRQTEEEDIFLNALNINLKIGEIVESLDLKTMAEQWKAYTMICEKYSSNVIHNIVFENCTGSLSRMTLKNIRSALEETQDQKLVLRSLKVSNFVIKILIKMCQTLKTGSMRNHQNLLDMLMNVYMYNPAYLLHTKKSPQLIDLYNTNVISAADNLVMELLSDEGFAQCFLKYDLRKLSPKDCFLGYILLVITVEKLIILQKNDDVTKLWLNRTDFNLTECIFKLLPHCHPWFNLGLKFSSSTSNLNHETYGLYEHLLTHTVSLATTFSKELYSDLQHKMLRVVLGKECYSSLFAADLWMLLARFSNHQLNMTQLICLCQVYQSLDKTALFAASPQESNLSNVIEMLFKLFEKEDKIEIYKNFSIADDDNTNLWTVLKLKNLPFDVQKSAEERVFKTLKIRLGKLVSFQMSTLDEIKSLIISMKLAASCTFMNMDTIEEELIKAWLQVCPKQDQLDSLQGELCKENVWYLNYIVALFALTESMIPVLQRNSDGLLKILHVTLGIVSTGNLEMKLVSLGLIFKLALYSNTMKSHMGSILHDIFKEMFKETNTVFKKKFYETIRIYYNNTTVRDIISRVVSEDLSLEYLWNHFIKHGTLTDNKLPIQEQLHKTSNFQYTHKCLQQNDFVEAIDSETKVQTESSSGNFEFADMDLIFCHESDTELPISKKPKLDVNEADVILKRLENDVEELAKIKENITLSNYRNRLLNVCERLGSLVN